MKAIKTLVAAMLLSGLLGVSSSQVLADEPIFDDDQNIYDPTIRGHLNTVGWGVWSNPPHSKS